MNGMSRKDLLEFLEYLGEKGLMNPQTASARKASVSSLLGILSDFEAEDVTKLDLDEVTRRFLNLKGSNFKQDSVKVYKSRTGSAIKDFVAYKKDPLSFKPNIGQRTVRSSEEKQKRTDTNADGDVSSKSTPQPTVNIEGFVFPIPLRNNVTVKVAGIPADLTTAEARKISNVILALATPEEL